MSELDVARAGARAAFNAASDRYDDEALSFWDRYGRRTVERLSLKPGDHVLDVCCGSGASALPAAAMVQPGGTVTGVDLAESMLALAKAKAERFGLTNTRWVVGDLLEPTPPDQRFDAVVCVFGIFFVPDIAAAVASLWKRVAPGGVLAVTTWGPDLFEPGKSAFRDAIRDVRPDLFKTSNPWDLIATADALGSVMREGGALVEEVVAEAGVHPIRSGADFWTIAMGSGYRGTIDKLTADQREAVRARVVGTLDERGVHAVRADVVYGRARRPR